MYILKSNLFLWWQSWIFSIITPVFRVTWSFRNHSNMLICSSINICIIINVENITLYFSWNCDTFFQDEKNRKLKCIWNSGGPLSALTCCVNVRLLSAIKKNIAVNLFSKLGWGAGSILRKLWWLSPWYFSADVYLAELHCRGREQVFELEARSPWWTDC